MRIVQASRPTGVSDYLVMIGGGREVLIDKVEFAHLAAGPG